MRYVAALLMGLLLSVAGTSGAFATDAPAEIPGATTVNADQLIALVGSTPNLVVVDARIKPEYQEAHLDGAVSLVDTDTNADTLAKVLKAKTQPVLFYCNGMKCGRAANAAKAALAAGYSKVYYYALGMTEWKERKLPLVTQ